MQQQVNIQKSLEFNKFLLKGLESTFYLCQGFGYTERSEFSQAEAIIINDLF